MKDFIIILPTHSSYLKVTENFLQLLEKNWPDCPFKIVVSITGKKVKFEKTNCLYNGEDASLINCIINVVEKYPAEYYISFLGDAFINKRIDNSQILKILNDISKNKVAYCSLQYVKNYKKEKTFNDSLRYINNLDRYSHNFTAFVVSRDFIKNELSRYKTDLDFEKAYLYKTKNFYFKNHLIVRKNYFNLLPSIIKGKWDRFNIRKLQKDNPEIDFADRKIQTRKEAILTHTHTFVPYLPEGARRIAKVAVEKVFKIKFGVEG